MANDTRITVVRGRPDAAELAAVTAVLIALARRAQEPEDLPGTVFADWRVKGGGPGPAVSWPRR
ncbi:acyl-CoA carboxylase subunit epsilon [Streptomyces sp. NPDC049099]|uniref:acyl-CoA carboxylase subunit epsilon n=1 Tax=unclassified Streptomyces TaxID=2593676 RepID=UPI0034217839